MPKVKLQHLDPEDVARDARRSEFVSTRNATLAAQRKRRLTLLENVEAARGDEVARRAWDALEASAPPGRRLQPVRVLYTYVCRPEPAQAAFTAARENPILGWPLEPPLSRLAAAGGRPLPLHLSLLAYGHLMARDGGGVRNEPDRQQPRRNRGGPTNLGATQTPSTAPTGPGLPLAGTPQGKVDWAKLIGLQRATGPARTTRIQEALRALERHRLAELTPRRPSHFTLLSEDGTGRVWALPELDLLEDSLPLPMGFFTRRWHIWLRPAEIATLFALMHATAVAPDSAYLQGVGLPETVRRARYEMSRERYSALHELIEFGLVDMVSPSIRPQRAVDPSATGLAGETHHVRVNWAGFEVDARTRITECLAASTLPPRLAALPALREQHAEQLRQARASQRLATTQDPQAHPQEHPTSASELPAAPQ